MPVTTDTGTDLLFLLSQASHALATELTVGLAELGISPREHCVLRTAMTGELTQSQVAERCALDKTTMVVTLDKLEREGYAERRLSGTDRRARIIGVTDSGIRIVAAGQRIIDQIFADVLESLPAGERKGFVAGLTRLAEGRLSTPVECEKPIRRRAPRMPAS
ncbi:MAG: MarR family winged helix-turn-helix transcriptional regulator [Micromonosporaceae bacterium]